MVGCSRGMATEILEYGIEWCVPLKGEEETLSWFRVFFEHSGPIKTLEEAEAKLVSIAKPKGTWFRIVKVYIEEVKVVCA